jgi:hypothetical protein
MGSVVGIAGKRGMIVAGGTHSAAAQVFLTVQLQADASNGR